MSDDLNKKIKQISDILGQEKVPDSVKNLLSSLSKGNNNTTENTTSNSNILDTKSTSNTTNELDENNEMLRKIRTIINKLENSNSDQRVVLLNAVKPFLNSNRQQKLNSCIKILQMANLSNLLEDDE